jgi:hypothetical protein
MSDFDGDSPSPSCGSEGAAEEVAKLRLEVAGLRLEIARLRLETEDVAQLRSQLQNLQGELAQLKLLLHQLFDWTGNAARLDSLPTVPVSSTTIVVSDPSVSTQARGSKKRADRHEEPAASPSSASSTSSVSPTSTTSSTSSMSTSSTSSAAEPEVSKRPRKAEAEKSAFVCSCGAPSSAPDNGQYARHLDTKKHFRAVIQKHEFCECAAPIPKAVAFDVGNRKVDVTLCSQRPCGKPIVAVAEREAHKAKFSAMSLSKASVGDFAVALASSLNRIGQCYVFLQGGMLTVVAEPPSDGRPYKLVDVARPHRWMKHITHFDPSKQKIGGNVIPVAMHGWHDKFVIARCDEALARNFDALCAQLEEGELVLCAGRSDGWYELRHRDQLDAGCIPIKFEGHLELGPMCLFDESSNTMLLANGESEPLDLDKQPHGAKLAHFPPIPADANGAVLLEMLFQTRQWQTVCAPKIEERASSTTEGDDEIVADRRDADESALESAMTVVRDAVEAEAQRCAEAKTAEAEAWRQANEAKAAETEAPRQADEAKAAETEARRQTESQRHEAEAAARRLAAEAEQQRLVEAERQAEAQRQADEQRLEAEDPHGCFLRALERGDVEVVERLLQDKRVDPAADNNYAIRLAAENGHLAVVERLLQDKRVDPAAGDNYAIRWAAWKGHLAVVERLLQDKRVDPAADDNHAIRVAAQNGHLAVVERLLQNNRVDPSADKNRAISLAAANGHLAVVERLLQDKRVDPAAENYCVIVVAAANGHLAVVERLLQNNRVDPSADKNCAIRLAAANGHLAVVERLLQDKRVDPAACDNFAIRWAAENGHLAVVERLLQDERVNPAAQNNKAICSAARNGHSAVVELLSKDARVDASAVNV